MVDYTDKDFNKDFTRHYSLLLQIEEQQYAYAIYEKRTGKLQALKTVSLQSTGTGDMLSRLKPAATADDMLQLPYHEVKVGVLLSPFTLVPRVLFEDEKAAQYLSLSAEIEPNCRIYANNVKGVYTRNVFAVQNSLVDYLQEVFERPKIFHTASALLEIAYRSKDIFVDQQLILDIKPGIIQLVYFENKVFKFMNQYTYVNKDDFMYYVLLVADQFMVDRNTADLKLSGEIVPDSLLFGELWKFFKNISFLPINESIVLPTALKEQPLYIHNTLLSLDLCE